MKLNDLQYVPTSTLASSQTVYRVQRRRARAGSVTIGHLKLAAAGDRSSRFAVASASVGYFAESPEASVYESLVRREAVSLSMTTAADRVMLCLRATRAVQLIDLRPRAPSWPVLQSLRFASTQDVAEDALRAGFEGIVYRSAQQHGQDCFVVFGQGLTGFRLVWRKSLVQADGSIHQALASAVRGGQITVVP